MRPWSNRTSLIEAPLAVGLYDWGVSRAPETLLGLGLAERLGATRTRPIPKPCWRPRFDEATGLINPQEVRTYLLDLAGLVQDELTADRFPVVVGGDCTILLGCLLAQKRRHGPSAGLCFLDGHTDFYAPPESPSGETADMDLFLAVGRGPAILADLDGMGPLVEEKNVVLLGYRDASLADRFGVADPKLHSAMRCFSLEDVHTYGHSNVVGRSVEHLSALDAPFWIHLDLDVLEDSAMPAVDYRMDGGLSPGEVLCMLRNLLSTGKACGLDIAVYNPDLDFDGSCAHLIIDLLGKAFGRNGN